VAHCVKLPRYRQTNGLNLLRRGVIEKWTARPTKTDRRICGANGRPSNRIMQDEH